MKINKNELKSLLKNNMKLEVKIERRHKKKNVISETKVVLIASIYFDDELISTTENILSSKQSMRGF
ncbi:MAG: hypothetical protein PVG65_00795 [Candidatus Thorarchaeota archaeon]|jgi:hypothetical protein